MPLKVVSFAAYLTQPTGQWRDDDYGAMKFIKAIKDEPINGWAWVPVGDSRRKLRQENATDAFGWFGNMAGRYIASQKLRGPLCLVPIPNSSATVGSRQEPRTLRLVQELAAVLKPLPKICDCLRWKKPMTPARKGGSRNRKVIYDNLVVTCDLSSQRVILIDDVKTTGAHLAAASAKISSNGGKCIMAICAGRTVWEQEDEPFSIGEEELADYVPE